MASKQDKTSYDALLRDARAMTDMARLVEEVFRDAPADPSRRA